MGGRLGMASIGLLGIKEDNQVNRAIRRISASLAVYLVLTGGGAQGQPPLPEEYLPAELPRGAWMDADPQMGIEGMPMPGMPESLEPVRWPLSIDPTLSPQPGAGSAGDRCEICSGGYRQPDEWYIEHGIRVWHHGGPTFDIPLSFRGAVAPGNAVMTNRARELSASPGYHFRLGKYLGRSAENRDHFVEFTFNGFHEFTSRSAVRGERVTVDGLEGLEFGNLLTPLILSVPGGVPGLDRADFHEARQRSRLNEFDLSFRLVPRGRPDRLVMLPNGRWQRQCQDGVYHNLAYGLRWISLDQRFGLFGEGQTDTVDTRGSYVIDTHNDMLGFHFGSELVDRHCRWNWGFRWRVTPMVNFAGQGSRITSSGDPVLGVGPFDSYRYRSRTTVSAFIDLGFMAEYQLRPNLTARAGYDIMWGFGLAVAGEQFDFDPARPAQLRTDATLFFQGLTASLDWHW